MPFRRRRRWFQWILFAAAVLGMSSHGRRATAASVPYVGSVPVTVGGEGKYPQLTGPVVAERDVPFILLDGSFDARYDLTLQNFVVKAADTGTLDFYYRVTNRSDHALRLLDMDSGRFTRPGSVDPIDVKLWDETTGTYAPLVADRSGSHFGGVALEFPQSQTLDPGESSRLFFIRTAATRYDLAGVTQFRSTPDTSTDSGFALTFNPVLDGPVVPPPTNVPLPGGAFAVLSVMVLLGLRDRVRATRSQTGG